MRKLMFLLLLIPLGGCAVKSDHMQADLSAPAAAAPAQGESAVVFLRPSVLGGAVQAPVAEAVEGRLQFVGIVSSKTKVLQKTTPGKHTYVVGGESGSLLEAELAGGKTYYVTVTPRMGVWKARFTLDPADSAALADPKFKEDFDRCEWHSAGVGAQTWFRENLPSMQEKYTIAMDKHRESEKPSILRPQDGLDAPLR